MQRAATDLCTAGGHASGHRTGGSLSESVVLEEIAARLSDQLRLLKRGSRTAMPRQQTLRATIDWSYQLLTESERRCFAAVGVYRGVDNGGGRGGMSRR